MYATLPIRYASRLAQKMIEKLMANRPAFKRMADAPIVITISKKR